MTSTHCSWSAVALRSSDVDSTSTTEVKALDLILHKFGRRFQVGTPSIPGWQIQAAQSSPAVDSRLPHPEFKELDANANVDTESTELAVREAKWLARKNLKKEQRSRMARFRIGYSSCTSPHCSSGDYSSYTSSQAGISTKQIIRAQEPAENVNQRAEASPTKASPELENSQRRWYLTV